jgi:hypothetical protein
MSTKQCPMRLLASVHKSNWITHSDCIEDSCAWWIDDTQILIGLLEAQEAHHCGLLGRVWGRDDRSEA